MLRNSYLTNWKDFRGSDIGMSTKITADSCKIKHCTRKKSRRVKRSDKRIGNDL